MDEITQEICTRQTYIAEERKHRGMRYDQLWHPVNTSKELNVEIACNLYAKITSFGWRGAVDHPAFHWKASMARSREAKSTRMWAETR